MNSIKVLDKGYVLYVCSVGDDMTPVDAARVSFAKRSTEYTDEQNIKLLNYLIKNKEYSCFRHNVLTLEIRMPIFVARQLWKYIVSSNWTEDQLGWNENSRRYITDDNEFYCPTEWREAPANKKQGSGDNMSSMVNEVWHEMLDVHQRSGDELYNAAVEAGIAPEQARLFIPAYGLYVTCFYTASLNSILHLLDERLEHKAQYETQQYAQAIADIVANEWPIIWQAWQEFKV